jgi:AraC-like DNA-binding protein
LDNTKILMEIFEPENPLLRKYVSVIYFHEESKNKSDYVAFPAPMTSIGLYRNALITYTQNEILIKKSYKDHFATNGVNQLIKAIQLRHEEIPFEIAISFKPLGFASFTRNTFQNDQAVFSFTDWDNDLEELFDNVFAQKENNIRAGIVEDFLLKKFIKIAAEEVLLKAVQMLSDFSTDYKITEIALAVGVHPKALYRDFRKYIGCNPAHFRRIVRFRNSVEQKSKSQAAKKFTEIYSGNNYTDQSYFIREFQKLAGANPKEFFKSISALGQNRVFFKFL